MSIWTTQFEPPTLPENAVHLWRIDLQGSELQINRLLPLLSADEVARADRFIKPEHRRRLIIRRAAVRKILAHYLAEGPESISFGASNLGKPTLSSAADFEFNWTDSADLAVLAVSRAGQVGVDIERVRPMDDLESLATRYFRPEEVAEIVAGTSPSAVSLRFFRMWTRKEALLKATGTGLSGGLESVRVDSGVPAANPVWFSNQGEEADWTLTHFTVSAEETVDEFPGAVATLRPVTCEYFDWPG